MKLEKVVKGKKLFQCFFLASKEKEENLIMTLFLQGLVQFDIDKKDNEELEFHDLKRKIAELPFVIYAFISPSGGLKFAVKTDFAKNDGDNQKSIKIRYKQAYQNLL